MNPTKLSKLPRMLSQMLCAALPFAATRVAASACHQSQDFPSSEDWVCTEISGDKAMYSRVQGDNLQLGFHATSHSSGWSSLAFAGNGGMKGAHEIVVRQVDSVWAAEDRHSDDYATPTLDASQDVKLLWAKQSAADGTSWLVLVPKNSCDPNDYAIEDKSRYFLWALGAGHEFAYHSSRGQFHGNLFRRLPPAATPPGAQEIAVVMPSAEVVLGDGGLDPTNPYKCGIFDLRQLAPGRDFTTEAVHVGMMDALLDAATEEYVHHMILYACEEHVADSQGFVHGSIIGECESMPRGCSTMKWAWAKGSLPIVLPEEAGLAFGKGNHWLALQMHYFNPSLKQGLKDSSGLKLYALPQTRQFEAGYIQLNGGTNSRMRDPVPAGDKQHTLSSFVVPESCSNGWPEEGLQLLGASHHMHLLGTQMSLDVARGGEYLGRIRQENHYDFNHQSLEEGSISKLMPGDSIRMLCTYDSSAQTTPTSFGDLTQQEMCYSVLLYYPKIPNDNFLVQRQQEANQDLANACKSAGTTYTDISACAEFYAQYPVNFLFTPGAALVPYSAENMCNFGFQDPSQPQYTPEEITTELSPGACPECYKTSSCTEADSKAHGQVLCEKVCDEYGMSVFPDTSRTTLIPKSHATWCGGSSVEYFTPDESVFEQPTCQYVGDMGDGSPDTGLTSAATSRIPQGCATSLSAAAALAILFF